MEQFNNDDFDINPNEGNTEEISVSVLDDALVKVRELEADYDAKKKISTEAHHKCEEAKMELIKLLERAGKTRWSVEGMKGFTMYDELKYLTIKDPNDKEKFFNFLQGEKVSSLLGQEPRDIFLAYASINAASFSKLCKDLVKLAGKEGESIELPGVQPPTTVKKLRSLSK